MINHIYLDLDGVLSDFHSEYGKHTKEEWLIEFPKFVMRGGFVNLKKLPDADELIDFLNALDIHITILSSAGNFPEQYHDLVMQKHQWLANHNISYPALVVPRKEFKARYATIHSLLIDDQVINCYKFWRAGGQSIQHVSAKDTIDKLKEALA